ncbi:MAG: hypothetical protein AAF394_10015 [Planctomycetota bacterium]
MQLRLVGLWPGLAPAWLRGEMQGLLVAVGFSWILCSLLLCTFVWPAWISGWLVAIGWLAIGGFWCVESVRSQFSIGRLLEEVAPNSEEVFSQAQREYLRGRWFEAEAKLLDILGKHPQDIAAAMTLVGVLRQTGRRKAALKRLEQLQLWDSASGWRFEILRETQLIEAEMAADSDDGAVPPEAADQDISGKS